jgi:hypothetical protein
MIYSTAIEGPAIHIRRVIDLGTKITLGVGGIGLFRAELLRVIALPRELNNELYLVLLAAATILTLGWIFVANKEFEIMCDFLDPLEYRIPSQTFIGMAIAVALAILLYTARNPLWFGMSYSVYMLLSVVGWKRLIGEMDKAIKGTRRNLRDEPEQKRDIYGRALDILDSYYIQQANLPRVWASFALGMLGLIFSIFAFILGQTIFNTVAYLIFIVSILVLEGGFAFYWRFKLYRQCDLLKDDLKHAQHRDEGSAN